MATIKNLIQTETDGSISFGDYELPAKKKLADFEHQGDIYKVKTYSEITRLGTGIAEDKSRRQAVFQC